MTYTAEHAKRALVIVERLLPTVRYQSEYDRLIEILRDSNRWNESHALFSQIRVNITLPFERKKVSGLDSLFVYVAENAAKTAYNCSAPSAPFDNNNPAPFDDDSFEWLLKCEKSFLTTQDSLLNLGAESQTNSEQVVVSNGEKRGWFASLWTSIRRRG